MSTLARMGVGIRSTLGFSRRVRPTIAVSRIAYLTRLIPKSNPDWEKDFWLGRKSHRQMKFYDGTTWRQVVTAGTDFSIQLGDIEGGNYTQVESDGTLRFVGNATTWKDVLFPQTPPKTSGAGNPSLGTLLSPLRGYSYAVNDAHDFDPQEYPHDGKVGTQIEWHIHWISMTNVAATRGVKWQLEWSYANPLGTMYSVATTKVDVTVPANTPANTAFYSEFGWYTPINCGPATMFFVRLTRIASDGTAPANDPFVAGVHFHYEVDTIGSRSEHTK